MRGTMMDYPLTLPTILERSGKIFHRVEIVSRKPDKSIVRTCYGEFYRRARRLASALTKLGLRSGDRVASLMWNHSGHLEAFFGVPCAGGILHTLNLRLHPHEIAAIARQADDRFLLIDDVLVPLFEKYCEHVSHEHVIVVPYGCNTVPKGYLNYEELLAEAGDDFRYPKIDENDGAAMCFTSGTTGFSKGVIYSHRSLVLHSFCCGLGEVFGMTQFDTVLPVAPMFHANAWGLPYACAMLGARLVLPGPNVDPESVLGLMVSERVTIACGVPTVWIAALEALEKNPGRWKFEHPIRVIVGGTAPPLELIRRLDRFGLQIKHLWGMTETTPIGTSGGLRSHMHDWPEEKKYETRAKQGWPAPFVEIRLMRSEGPESKSQEVPWDGVTSGEIEIRGPWIAASYHESPDQAHRWTADGWFRTGDVAILERGSYRLLGRTSVDIIKTGGFKVSALEIEEVLRAHPCVGECAVVGVADDEWGEQVAVALELTAEGAVTLEQLQAWSRQRLAPYKIPRVLRTVAALPRNAMGKVMKTELAALFSARQ